MNTGHDGSLSTAHANGPRHALWRLETMAMMSDVDLPATHIRNQVASAIDVIVHLARLRDGRRVVFDISAVEGIHDGEPLVRQVFAFRPRTGAAGRFEATGGEPVMAALLAERGAPADHGLFEPGVDA
jgi:pilus assembly protein CpaF